MEDTTLSQIREKIGSYLSQTTVETAYLFGSYASGHANRESDVDLLITLPQDVNLLQIARWKRNLEQVFEKRVDLLTEESIAPEIRTFIDKQKILIYERKR